MAMPSGESPEKAQQYYEYLQATSRRCTRPDTWHVHWVDLAWLWGFLIVLVVIAALWVWQYRSTRQRDGSTRWTASAATRRRRPGRRRSSSCF